MCGQQVSDVQGDYEEQKLLADQRLTELEKLTENYKGSLEDIEKLKMEVSVLTITLVTIDLLLHIINVPFIVPRHSY